MSFQGFLNGDNENDITLPLIGTIASLGSDAGEYAVIVTISDTNYEGQATETFVLNSLLSTSLDEFGIKVFPNPTSDFLQISGVSN